MKMLIFVVILVAFLIWIAWAIPAPVAAQTEKELVLACVGDFEFIGAYIPSDPPKYLHHRSLDYLRRWEAEPADFHETEQYMVVEFFLRAGIPGEEPLASGLMIYHAKNDPDLVYLLIFDDLTPRAASYNGDVHPCGSYRVTRNEVEWFEYYFAQELPEYRSN